MHSISLIIAVYKNIEVLALILKSISKQSITEGVEVIIAEDNNSNAMREFVSDSKAKYQFPILHVAQEDIGFRKCKILNEAVRVSNNDYLIFVDGDCILHKQLIAEHLKFRNKGIALYGRRVMVSETLSKMVINSKNLGLLNLFYLILFGSKRLDAALYNPFSKPKWKLGFWGHNWGIFKEDLLQVKGYDEGYEKAGIGEDTDLEWRLEQVGIKFCRLKNRLIQYHIWHKENYPNTLEVEARLKNKQENFKQTGDKKWLMGSL